MKASALACAVGLMLIAPAEFQSSTALKFTMHIDLIQSDTPAPNDWSRFAAQLARQAVPPGGVDQTVIISAKASRIEQHQAFVGMPAGIVTLFRGDEEFGYDPAAQTFWKQPPRLRADELSEVVTTKPDIKVDRTGRFETIDGMRAERVTTTMTMPMPKDAAAAPIPDLPPNLVVTMDAWVTDAWKIPGDGKVPLLDQKLFAELGIAHVAQLTDNRFPVRLAVRMNLITGIEMVVTIKNVAQTQVPDSVFEIPAGFKEVPPPSGRVRAPRRKEGH